MSHKFFLGSTAICIALSFATVKNPKLGSERLAVMMIGAVTAGTALSQSKTVQSSWEQRMNETWTEAEKVKAQLVERELELNRRATDQADAIADERRKLEADVARDREMLTLQAQNLETQIQAELDGRSQELDRRASELKQATEAAKARLEADKRQVLLDAQSQVTDAVDRLKTSTQKTVEECARELEKAGKETELWKRRYQLLERPQLPRRREGMAEVYCEDYIWSLWRNRDESDKLDPIKTDCDDRQPVDYGTHFTFWLKLRDNSRFEDVKKTAIRERIALDVKTAVPFFVLESKEGLVRVDIPYDSAYKPPKEYQQKQDAEQKAEQVASRLKASEPPKTHFTQFLETCHQLALLGATGDGKTTLIENILNVFADLLGGQDVRLVVTNPKPSQGSIGLGKPKYGNFKTAIFGLLEASVEIQYRLNLNEKAIAANVNCPDHPPTIYFFDEYSQTAAKWNSVTQEKFNQTIEQFRRTLDGVKQGVLDEIIEDISPKKFASGLLLFCWQVGRSEKVKVLISGQNLMPSVLGMNALDLWNVGFLCLGDTVNWAFKSRVYEWQTTALKAQYQLRVDAATNDPAQKFFGLYCPPKTSSYFALNPGIGEYKTGQLFSRELQSDYPNDGSSDDGNSDVTALELADTSAPNSSQVTEAIELIEPAQAKELSNFDNSIDPRNCYPERSSSDEKRLWEELQELVSNGKKKWAIINVLKKQGNKYSAGVQYIEYLKEKYQQNDPI